MSTTPDPVSTPGPGVPDPPRPASDPATEPGAPHSPGPVPDDIPDPNVDPDVDAAGGGSTPEETARGLQSHPGAADPAGDDPGSSLNF